MKRTINFKKTLFVGVTTLEHQQREVLMRYILFFTMILSCNEDPFIIRYDFPNKIKSINNHPIQEIQIFYKPNNSKEYRYKKIRSKRREYNTEIDVENISSDNYDIFESQNFSFVQNDVNYIVISKTLGHEKILSFKLCNNKYIDVPIDSNELKVISNY